MAGELELERVRPKLAARCSDPLIKGLLDDLLCIGIFNLQEKDSIMYSSPNPRDKCRELIDAVIRKGNNSCIVLLQKISEWDPTLSEDLGITVSVEKKETRSKQRVLVDAPQPKEEKKASQQEANEITLCSEKEYKEIIAKELDRYPIYDKSTRKRWALIICNMTFDEESIKERNGAKVDTEGMRTLLEGLGYTVRWKMNLSAEEMRIAMKTFAARTDHDNSDSTVLVFMSHGERDLIYGIDCKREHDNVTGTIHVDEIIKTFNNKNCPGLRNKPKMIIIQACRGHERSQVLVRDGAEQLSSIDQEDLDEDAARLLLKEMDFICFYSTTPDTVSYRHPIKGSLFIQRLIAFMKENAHNLSIEDIFRKVQHSFKDGEQMPTQDRKTLLKKFFLFPGY